MGKQPKRKLIRPTGAEEDVHSKNWRKWIIWQRGELAYWKRTTNRKERRDNERQAREWDKDY
jgi:hypothetical protein